MVQRQFGNMTQLNVTRRAATNHTYINSITKIQCQCFIILCVASMNNRRSMRIAQLRSHFNRNHKVCRYAVRNPVHFVFWAKTKKTNTVILLNYCKMILYRKNFIISKRDQMLADFYKNNIFFLLMQVYLLKNVFYLVFISRIYKNSFLSQHWKRVVNLTHHIWQITKHNVIASETRFSRIYDRTW